MQFVCSPATVRGQQKMFSEDALRIEYVKGMISRLDEMISKENGL